MAVSVVKQTLETRNWKHNCFLFLPDESKERAAGYALFAHGYTSNKTSILNWSSRLAEEGMPALVMDIPGHYQGSFCEVEDFDEFCEHSPEIFTTGENFLKQHSPPGKNDTVVLGGHSLGAMLALMALNLPNFLDRKALAIGVGLGWPPADKTHIFASPFYKSTLNIRGQLVSPALHPDRVFPWIKEEKENLDIGKRRVHFICGEDDVVVGKEGAEKFARFLEEKGSHTSVEKPKKLPHHQPDMAGAHIKKFIKDEGLFAQKP